MVGLFMGKNGESDLTIGGYNLDRVNDLECFNTAPYNGMWELGLTTLNYATTSRSLYTRNGVLLLHTPFISIPFSTCF